MFQNFLNDCYKQFSKTPKSLISLQTKALLAVGFLAGCVIAHIGWPALMLFFVASLYSWVERSSVGYFENYCGLKGEGVSALLTCSKAYPSKACEKKTECDQDFSENKTCSL